MKSMVFLGFYTITCALGIGINYYQLQRLIESSNVVMFIMILLVIALQLPFYLFFKR